MFRPGYRKSILIALVLLGAAMLLSPLGVAEAATDTGASRRPGIDVVQLGGLLDPPNAELLRDSIRAVNARGSTLLVLQINSIGGLDVEIASLVRSIKSSRVPIAVWVGPSGGKAKGAGAALMQAAGVASVSNGSSVGPIEPVLLDKVGRSVETDTLNQSGADYPSERRVERGATAIATTSLQAKEALRAGAVDRVDAIIGELIVGLNGKSIATARGAVKVSTAVVDGTGNDRRLKPNQVVRFRRLGLDGQVLHTMNSPSLAYLLFVIGLCLIVFEFFTASIGIAGLVGALSVVGAAVGFSHLPLNLWAAALIIVGITGYAIDVQAGGMGPWTFLGGAALLAGSITLYGGSARLDPRWWIIAVVWSGASVFMLGGVNGIIRARFSTPTVGREGMIGQMGRAEVDVDPSGVVRIRDSLWRARTNRWTPIAAGDVVRVVAVDGLELEVEPEVGGAKDYRR